MKKAYLKDVIRFTGKNRKRFAAIIIITALGVAMFTGLYAACLDMYYAADQYFRGQNLFDIRIQSTLGLTEDDVDALTEVDGVLEAEGAYSKKVYTEIDDVQASAELTVLSKKNINLPLLLEGSLPLGEGEIAVTEKYISETGKAIGDSVQITDDKVYTIADIVMDPQDIQSDGSGSAFRASQRADFTFFVSRMDINSDIYTSVYLTLENTKEIPFYKEEYEKAVDTVIKDIEENLKQKREKARFEAVAREAGKEIEKAEASMYEEFEKAEKEFADAQRELERARQELLDGEAALIKEERDAKQKFAEAYREIKEGRRKLAEAELEISDGEKQLSDGEAELDKKARELEIAKSMLAEERKRAEGQFLSAEQELKSAQKELDNARKEVERKISLLRTVMGPVWPKDEWEGLVDRAAELTAAGKDQDTVKELVSVESTALKSALRLLPASLRNDVLEAGLGLGRIEGGQRLLNAEKAAFSAQREDALVQLAEAEKELFRGEEELNKAYKELKSKRLELEAGRAEIKQAQKKLDEGETELKKEEAAALKKIADARAEIEEGKEELAKGETELRQQQESFLNEKAEGIRKINEAYKELSDMERARWYIQDRSSLESYSSLNNDLSSIEALGRVFPVIFLLVSILVSLTAMSRMVEEERGIIAVYKALGYGNAAIYGKYLIFAFMACLAGGILGNLMGFILLPRIIMLFLKELYKFPGYYLRFDAAYGAGGIVLFMAAVLGSTALTCRKELARMPAALMRPKAPRPGSRILLERMPFIWRRLSFLNKVTLRNIFRYKKRLFMTISGILGCTALILFGFAIKDSVEDLAPKQYDDVYLYDLMVMADEEYNDDLIKRITSDNIIDRYLNMRMDQVKLLNKNGDAEQVQLLVIPEGLNSEIDEYIRLENRQSMPVSPDDKGVLVTQNASQILGLSPGDTVFIQDTALNKKEAVITDIVKNYLGNNVYLSQELYEDLFGIYTPNGILAHFRESIDEPAAYAESFTDDESVRVSLSTAAMKEDFGFDLIYAVVLILITMAGCLALVVLFTLSSTNISERERELATIKVLGFYDKEVRQYVNKETLLLTLIGIGLGLPAGRYLSNILETILVMPSIHFAVHIKPISYVLSAAITFCFGLLINRVTNPVLDRISMVEALKSIE